MAPSARDKKTLITLLEQAQLVYLLTRLPKKQVLDDPKDVARLEGGLAEGEPETAFMLDPTAESRTASTVKKPTPRRRATRK